MYKVIGHPNSRTVRVLWALEELGQEWELLPAKPQSEDARAHNPSGKVPSLETEGQVITDSVAIVTYLADAHGALTYPAGSLDRARQDSMTQFACDEIDQPLWTAAKHRFALPEEVRVPDVKEAARFEWNRACGILAERLEGPFVMGDRMTIPDIILGHCAGWANNAGFDWPEGTVGAYFEKMQAHPSLASAREKGKAMLPAD